METLEFVIHPNGRVEEKVTGIVGASCAEVTAAIEAQLGQVVSCQQTSEFFAQSETVKQAETAASRVQFSHW